MEMESVKLPGLRSNLAPPGGAGEVAFIKHIIERLLGVELPALSEGEVFYTVSLPDGWRVGRPENDFRRGLISPDGYFLISIHDMGADSKLVFEMRYRAILFFGNFKTSDDLKNDPLFHDGEYGKQKVTWVIKDGKLGDIIYPPSGEMLVLETNKDELDRQRDKVQATVDGMNNNWLESWGL
ncbi:MAG: hypothetical protein LBJ91_03135 [Clostridiales Family XIII bacterium]|jgi:hypothetical protein|nr:hypothetical protein [Clostridiales Family XIII bacterium]